MKKKLIINADDFGLTDSVNKAIIDVYKAGNLTSTTLMVNMPGTAGAVELAKSNPGLKIGLHFCITEGKPLSNPKTLINDNGSFISRSELSKQLILGKIDPKEVATEFKAQLKKIEELGIKISHTDSHQHTMMFPPIFDAIRPVLELQKLRYRITKSPHVSQSLLFKHPLNYLKKMMNYRFAERIQNLNINRTNDCLVSIFDLDNQNDFTKNTYHDLINATAKDDIIELMVHPYIIGDELVKMYATSIKEKNPFLQKCEREYQMLSEEPLFQDYDLRTFQNIDQ